MLSKPTSGPHAPAHGTAQGDGVQAMSAGAVIPFVHDSSSEVGVKPGGQFGSQRIPEGTRKPELLLPILMFEHATRPVAAEM